MQRREIKPSLAFYIDTMQKGGANRVMAILANYFAECHYDVWLINDSICNDADYEYQVDERIHREILNVDKKSTLLSNFFRIKKIRSLLKEKNIGAAVSFMGPPNVRLLIAGIGLKCKRIVSVRNDPNIEYGASAFAKRVTGLIFSFASACVFQTQDAENYFSKKIQKKSKVILNPVHPGFFQIKRNQETCNIVTVGRLFEQKNHKLLIDSFNLIQEKITNDKLIIYGEGPLRKDLEQYVLELGLSNQVLLPGQISNVADVLANASVFVLSSDYEGLPNALMEAMVVGVPVISTDCPCGGPRSIIQNSSQGVLVPCGDARLMANALLDLLSNKKRQDHMSIHERERAKQFHTKVICAEWEKFIIDVYSGMNNP